MRTQLAILIAGALAVLSCSSSSQGRTYTLQGQVLSIAPDRQEATIKHEEVKGLMPAMTMPYKVKDARLLGGVAPGDLVDARLVVASNEAYLSEVRKVGEAPLPTEKPAASSGFELLRPGEAVPDVALVNQDGKIERFSAFKGEPVVVTFMYTSCPLPNFCPLMDRNFARIQQTLKSDPAYGRVHLVSVSFDPAVDTPAVLKQHARELGADLSRWTFFTGDRDDIDRFASRFGVSISRAPDDPRNITHNLRTAIVGRDGRLVKTYTGNEWTPSEVVADLKSVIG